MSSENNLVEVNEMREVLGCFDKFFKLTRRINKPLSLYFALEKYFFKMNTIINEFDCYINRETAALYAGEMVVRGFENVIILNGADYGKSKNRWGIKWTYNGVTEESWIISNLPVNYAKPVYRGAMRASSVETDESIAKAFVEKIENSSDKKKKKAIMDMSRIKEVIEDLTIFILEFLELDISEKKAVEIAEIASKNKDVYEIVIHTIDNPKCEEYNDKYNNIVETNIQELYQKIFKNS